MEISQIPLVFDRQSAIAWSQAVLSDHDVVFLDTETTGLDNDAEVIEIAVVDRHGNVLVDSLVRPTRPIPLEATFIHGIFDHHVASAPTWAEVFPTIVPLCRERRVVVYNAEYDRRLIQQSCRFAGLQAVNSRFHCAMQAYTCFYGGVTKKGWPRHQRLEIAAERFALEIPQHRALGDALACLGVVRGMAYTT